MDTTDTYTAITKPPCVLEARAHDGIEVSLLWWRGDDQLVVAVVDAKANHAFHIRIDGQNAMDAFHHPYAHAAALLGEDAFSANGALE